MRLLNGRTYVTNSCWFLASLQKFHQCGNSQNFLRKFVIFFVTFTKQLSIENQYLMFFTIANIKFYWCLLQKLLIIIIISRFKGPKLQKILRICIRSFVNFDPDVYLSFFRHQSAGIFYIPCPEQNSQKRVQNWTAHRDKRPMHCYQKMNFKKANGNRIDLYLFFTTLSFNLKDKHFSFL